MSRAGEEPERGSAFLHVRPAGVCVSLYLSGCGGRLPSAATAGTRLALGCGLQKRGRRQTRAENFCRRRYCGAGVTNFVGKLPAPDQYRLGGGALTQRCGGWPNT